VTRKWPWTCFGGFIAYFHKEGWTAKKHSICSNTRSRPSNTAGFCEALGSSYQIDAGEPVYDALGAAMGTLGDAHGVIQEKAANKPLDPSKAIVKLLSWKLDANRPKAAIAKFLLKAPCGAGWPGCGRRHADRQ
jgi:hypothetical protein